MPNATSETLRAGWEFFRSMADGASLEEVNAVLAERQLGAISHRAYRHYRALERHGYDHYVTINEFDMQVKHHLRPTG
jgi:hypothetical protein